MANLCPTRVVCRKTDENIRKLSQAFTMSEINQDIQHLLLVLRKRQRGDYLCASFHDYSTIMRVKYALFWPHFRLFSAVTMLELCQSWFHLLIHVVLL